MRNFDWAVLISIIWAGVYLLFVFSVRRREIANRITQIIMVYALLSTVWETLWVIYKWDLLGIFQPSLSQWIVSFGSIILALVFLICSMLFLQVNSGFWTWFGISAGIGCVVFTIFASFFTLPESLRVLIFGLLVVGWLATVVKSCYITYMAFHQAKKPQYKNRVGYWGFALLITILGDLILLSGVVKGIGGTPATEFPAGVWIIGSTLHMIGVLIVGYVVLIHNAIDLVWGFLRLLSYIAVTIIGVFLFMLILGVDLTGINILQSETVEWVVKAVILVVLVVPGLSWLYRYANQLLFGTGVNRETAVREYGLSISNLVDLDRLAEVALEFLDKTFGVEFSLLLIVDEPPKDDYYQLLPVANPLKPGQENWQSGRIQCFGILARHFFDERRFLSQYDLDFLPRFKNNTPEKEWLSRFQAELFVPILTKDSWIGLFVVGPKANGDQFFEDEIDLLSTLANQTVAALQNARLFSDLHRLNDDLRKTYQALEEANQKLRELDKMKSDFIGVVSHEMRTPLANMGLSLQVLELSGTQNLTPDQREQLHQISSGIKTSRSMVDNLITMAALLNNQTDLSLEKFDFQEVLDWISHSFVQYAANKGIKLKVDKVGDALLVGDRKLLITAISHLIENALKFTGPQGSVWVSCWTTTDALWLDVRDTGRGIEKDQLDKVWQSFTQLQTDAMRRGVEGLGLGLSLVRLIVLSHGGQVFVESEIGSGSVFGFRIPLKGPEFPLKAIPTEPTRKEIPGLVL